MAGAWKGVRTVARGNKYCSDARAIAIATAICVLLASGRVLLSFLGKVLAQNTEFRAVN